MATITLARLDDRLIHGQVAITVLRGYKCKKVVIVDDNLVNDPMQKVILQAVCPKGIAFELISTKEAGERWKRDRFGKVGPIIVLFKDVENIHRAFEEGLNYGELQLGGQRDVSAGRHHVSGQVYLNEQEAAWLSEMQDAGVDVYLQAKPQESKTSWNQVVSQHFPSLK